jgi:hypothetical protein
MWTDNFCDVGGGIREFVRPRIIARGGYRTGRIRLTSHDFQAMPKECAATCFAASHLFPALETPGKYG